MTRINLVHPSELTDQHLFAEFREIKMVPKALQRSIHAAQSRGDCLDDVYVSIPNKFTLNRGHVSFFYDKGTYLEHRFADLRLELAKRDITYNRDSVLDSDGVFSTLPYYFNRDYIPTPEALTIIRKRIAERIAAKPNWYRYYGKPISNLT